MSRMSWRILRGRRASWLGHKHRKVNRAWRSEVEKRGEPDTRLKRLQLASIGDGGGGGDCLSSCSRSKEVWFGLVLI
jgi:hypothetical protein